MKNSATVECLCGLVIESFMERVPNIKAETNKKLLRLKRRKISENKTKYLRRNKRILLSA